MTTQPITESKRGRGLPTWAILTIVLLAFGAVVGFLFLLLRNPPQRSLCDAAAPEFTLQLFEDYRGSFPGDTVSLSDLAGKGVVLNFWASWCQPCEQEAAELEAAWREYRDQGLVVLGVDYYDQDPAAMKYLQKFGITFPNGPDLGGRISKPYTIGGVPETFFINPEGQIVGCRYKGPLTENELRRRIEGILPD